MAFYGESSIVDDFVHKSVEVQIHVASRGAIHCEVAHEPEEKQCLGCGTKIASSTIYFVILNNSIIDDIEYSSPDEARAFAIDYVEHLIDGRDRGEVVDDDVKIDIDDESTRDTLPPPPMQRMENDGADWGMDPPTGDRPVSAALRIMRQLNWPGKITEIFDRLGIK